MDICPFDSISSVQFFSCVWLFASPWTAACQASLSITSFQSMLKFMSIELVMPSNHLILCRPLLLLPSIFPSIWVFSMESVLHIVWWLSIYLSLFYRIKSKVLDCLASHFPPLTIYLFLLPCISYQIIKQTLVDISKTNLLID